MAHAGDVHVGKILGSAGYFGFIIREVSDGSSIGISLLRCVVGSIAIRLSSVRHVFDRLHDLLIATAAAKITCQVIANLLLRRLVAFVEQRFRAENKSRSAVAALQRAELHEGILQRMKLAVSAQSFHGQNFATVGVDG